MDSPFIHRATVCWPSKYVQLVYFIIFGLSIIALCYTALYLAICETIMKEYSVCVISYGVIVLLIILGTIGSTIYWWIRLRMVEDSSDPDNSKGPLLPVTTLPSKSTGSYHSTEAEEDKPDADHSVLIPPDSISTARDDTSVVRRRNVTGRRIKGNDGLDAKISGTTSTSTSTESSDSSDTDDKPDTDHSAIKASDSISTTRDDTDVKRSQNVIGARIITSNRPVAKFGEVNVSAEGATSSIGQRFLNRAPQYLTTEDVCDLFGEYLDKNVNEEDRLWIIEKIKQERITGRCLVSILDNAQILDKLYKELDFPTLYEECFNQMMEFIRSRQAHFDELRTQKNEETPGQKTAVLEGMQKLHREALVGAQTEVKADIIKIDKRE